MLRCNIEVVFNSDSGQVLLTPKEKDDEVVLDHLFNERTYLTHTKKTNNGGTWIISFKRNTSKPTLEQRATVAEETSRDTQ